METMMITADAMPLNFLTPEEEAIAELTDIALRLHACHRVTAYQAVLRVRNLLMSELDSKTRSRQ